MNKLKYIIPIGFLLFGACTSPEEVAVPDSEDSSVQFRVTVGEGENALYESEYFKEGDEIRIFCPVNYSTPNFKDEGSFYTYEYTSKDDTLGAANYPFKFSAVGKGFDWRTLTPTAIYFPFEAMHFPGKEYLEEVPEDQDEEGALEKADMLIAYRRQLLSERGKRVPLTFHHAFAMVQVKVKLPVGDNPAEGPFPPEAVQSAYLRSMLRAYEVSYSEVIDNDGRRTVRVSDADDKTEAGSDRRKNVIMRRTVSPVKTDDTEARYQEYLFQAIVPEQSLLNEGKDFLYFNVKRNDGNEGTTLYKFVPNKAEISLKAGHRLNLSLAIDAVTHEVVVLTAILEPWSKAEVDMELVPVKPKTQP